MLNELNQVMDYIEEHLTEELSLEQIAKFVGVSDYHFRKVFYYLAGMSLSEYIKNRRLSEASKDLMQGVGVTEVAYHYGYQSLDGFTRAFKKWSGMVPSEVKPDGFGKVFPKLSFIITVKGGVTMDYKVIDKAAFNFVGVSKRVPMQFEGVNQEIVKLAQSITPEQRKEMRALQNVEPLEIINASYEADADFLKEDGELTHLIGVLSTHDNAGEQLEVVPVPAQTWAVFPNEGPFPATLQNTMASVYAEWLPSSNYELVKAPTFSFTKMDPNKSNYAYSEVWVAVKKRG